jgi:hypothetical protein
LRCRIIRWIYITCKTLSPNQVKSSSANTFWAIPTCISTTSLAWAIDQILSWYWALALKFCLIPFSSRWTNWLGNTLLQCVIIIGSGSAFITNSIYNNVSWSTNTLNTIKNFIGFTSKLTGLSYFIVSCSCRALTTYSIYSVKVSYTNTIITVKCLINFATTLANLSIFIVSSSNWTLTTHSINYIKIGCTYASSSIKYLIIFTNAVTNLINFVISGPGLALTTHPTNSIKIC